MLLNDYIYNNITLALVFLFIKQYASSVYLFEFPDILLKLIILQYRSVVLFLPYYSDTLNNISTNHKLG